MMFQIGALRMPVPYQASRLRPSTPPVRKPWCAATACEPNAINPAPTVSSQMFHSGWWDSLREEGRFPVYSLGMVALENGLLSRVVRLLFLIRPYAMMLHSMRAAVT